MVSPAALKLVRVLAKVPPTFCAAVSRSSSLDPLNAGAKAMAPLPAACDAPRSSVPALIVMPPENVLAPDSVSVLVLS